MIKDYKGEMPKNVTTLEKAKAKKPFYKDWKFWVLTGLMTLFGACSIYGLVLGSQYVKAIERASHIIADAQSVESKSQSLKKNKINAIADDPNRVSVVDLGSFYWWKNTSYGFYAKAPDNIFPVPNNNVMGKIFCERYETTLPNVVWNNTSGFRIALNQRSVDDTFPTGYFLVNDGDYYNLSAVDFKTAIAGVMLYYYNDGSGSNVYDQGYTEGYTQGSADGYDDGYQDGYSDGSDAINVNQSVKVLLPAGAENSCSFTTYLDGVPDQQGILSSSSSFGAYGEFERNRNQKLRIDLTLPSGSRAFFMYVPHWTSAYPSDENYSLRQSWAVSGVTYLPTWVDKPEIYVGITSALVDDLTYDTISVAFDVDHWGDVRVGAYQQGYQDGYVDGQQNPTAYDSGYDAGYADGQAQGETDGFNRGVAVGSSGSQSLALMFKTAFQLPFDQLYRFLNFNLLGINFLSLFTALISVSIGIMVIKKVL